MRKNLVLTLTGHDRIGIVERVTKIVLNARGNVDSSRMARLGGEFAMLMLISLPESQYEELNHSIQHLRDDGFSISICPTMLTDPEKLSGWMPYQVQVSGADHEGIVHNIAYHLAEHGINIETMDTNMTKAPMSGTPLFTMSAVVLVPPQLSLHDMEEDLEIIGDNMNVDIEIAPYRG
ncbi:MAG: transcriptional regulator [Deltaproteobacteria bacterium]|nr:transcriptional regulator [Deltaproteobacteria bacterium]